MDSAINTSNQLIARKGLQKKWLMQNLLTGKKRLKGFNEEWQEIHIKDVSREVSIRNKADNQLTVLSCTKHKGLVPSLEYFGRKIFSDDVSTYKIVPKNHFAYATNHIEEGSIGYQETLEEALISPMYTVFKTDSAINDTFFYKLLKSHKLVYQYQNRMEGSIDRRGGLRWDAFSIIKVQIPSYEEQFTIAKVLQIADKEIQLLKAKTERLREQKKGLMQVLLTGKKRLTII
jgi:type I restriction enzyme S subunit